MTNQRNGSADNSGPLPQQEIEDRQPRTTYIHKNTVKPGEGRSGHSAEAPVVITTDMPTGVTPAERPREPSLAVLTEVHKRVLEASAISDEVMDRRGYQSLAASVEHQRYLKSLDIHVPLNRCSGILIPIRDIWRQVVYHQFRPDDPPKDSNGKPRKYVDPTGHGKVLDIPNGLREDLADPTIPLWITEGSKKVDAGVTADLCIIGVLGVHCFDTPTTSWAGIELRNRLVYICYDSDAATNKQVQSAERKLKAFLEERGAEVKVLRMGSFPDGEKCGLDDYLASGYEIDDLVKHVAADYDGGLPELEDVLKRVSDVEEEAYSWLWPDRIPYGKFSLLEGDPSLGKSTITLDIAARLTRGDAMPDGTCGDVPGPQNVLLMASEDDIADTIRPRFRVAEGNSDHLYALQAVYTTKRGTQLIDLVKSLPLIREIVERYNIKLIVIDPVMQYMPGASDSYKDQDIRKALTPITELAKELSFSIIGLRHLRKTKAGEASNPLYAGMGGIGFGAVARSVSVVGVNPDDETGESRIFASTKMNIARPPASLTYTLQDVGGYARVRWGTQSTITSTQLFNGRTDNDAPEVARAKEFIIEVMGEGTTDAKHIKALARDLDIKSSTLQRAKTQLGIVSRRIGGGEGSYVEWRWPVNVTSLVASAPVTPDD